MVHVSWSFPSCLLTKQVRTILDCNSSIEVFCKVLTHARAGTWSRGWHISGNSLSCAPQYSTFTVSRLGLLVINPCQCFWFTDLVLVWGFGASLIPRGGIDSAQENSVCTFPSQERCQKDRKFCFPWQQSNCIDVKNMAYCPPLFHFIQILPGSPLPLRPAMQTQHSRLFNITQRA